MASHLSAEQVALALRLRARGLSFREVGEQISCSDSQVWQLVAGQRRREPKPWGWLPGLAGASAGF